ncbi:MAG: adenylate/guanylate cyclase domain-containing protein [Kiloniellales bacterium]
MSAAAAAPRRRAAAGRSRWRRPTLRQVRLASGLVLFTYLVSHFLNHALGLVSLEAMEAGRLVFLALWRNWVGTPILYLSLVAHLLLALWALYWRRQLMRIPFWEMAQLVLGLAIMPLLLQHILGTRIAFELLETTDSYTYVVMVLWLLAPEIGLQQAAGLSVAWLHCCIGLHLWLRLKPWYGRLVPYLYGLALLLPVAALTGFVMAGKEIAVLAQDPDWVEDAMLAIGFPSAENVAWLHRVETLVLGTFAALVVLTLAARQVRGYVERRHGLVRIGYPDGRVVEVPVGVSVLEASRLAGIAHASVCGGRGRCSTCRVRVGEGLDEVVPASEAERRVLDRVGAPPNVRLACQLRPAGDIGVTPLLPPTASPRDGFRRAAYLQGTEAEIAILFADLRAFTKLSERRLPYDVVFLLNRYFESMGRAVEDAGGRIDKFIGDGVMALFGLDSKPDQACRQALTAARTMGAKLEELNQALKPELEAPLRIGIGIHVGPAIVGEMGYSRATSVTAVGDAVNTASRLEAQSKGFGAELVVSEAVAERAGIDLSGFEARETQLRGRREPLKVRVVPDARSLPGFRR